LTIHLECYHHVTQNNAVEGIALTNKETEKPTSPTSNKACQSNPAPTWLVNDSWTAGYQPLSRVCFPQEFMLSLTNS